MTRRDMINPISPVLLNTASTNNPFHVCPIARHLPIVDTLDAEGKPRFITRGYEDFRFLKPVHEAGSIENKGVPSTELAQFIPQNNAEYTLYDLEGLSLADGEVSALTIRIFDPRAYAGFAVQDQLFALGRHGNRNKKWDDGMTFASRQNCPPRN